MMGDGNRRLCHPLVPIVYLIVVLVFAMAFLHPVLALCSFACAIVCNAMVSGLRATLKMLAWQVPLLLVVGVANMVFSASGSTGVFSIGSRVFYLESLVYGLTSGCMLVSVMAWFAYGDKVLDSDQVLLVGAKVLPVVSLVLSMVLRLVPQFLRRGSQIADARSACTAAGAAEGKVKRAARQSTVLMGWAMEDSLELADSMRCRGWGCGRTRTSCEMRKMRGADWVALALVGLLAALALLCNLQALSSSAFYPKVAAAGEWYLYLPYAALLLVPVALRIAEWLRWR